MSLALMRFCVLVSVFGLMAGCGGGPGGSGSGSGGSGGGGGDDNPTTVTVTFAGAPIGLLPAAVATRVGTGSFSPVTLNSGMLSLKVPAGTTNLAVAYVCPSSLLTQQWVFELSTTDGTSFTLSCWQSLSPPQSGTLTGSVDAGAVAGVSQLEIDAFNGGYIGRFASVVTPVDAFSLSTESGNNRVDVLAYDTQQTGTTTERSLLAVKDFSSQLVPGALNGGNAVVLGASDETTSQPIIFANAPAGFSPPSASVTYVLGSGGGYSVASNAVNHYPVIPAGASEAGDYYDFLSVIGDSKGTFVGSEVATNSPGAVTMTFPVARF